MALVEVGAVLRQEWPRENIYGHTKKLRFIQHHLDAQRGALSRPITLLDFGCGNGSAVSQFLMDDGIEYYGVDFHEQSLRHARASYGGPHRHFLPEVPPGVIFDVVVYADVLEHLDDPLTVLRQHRRQLHDGGLIIAAIPNGYGPFENEKRIAAALHLEQVSRAWKYGHHKFLCALEWVRKRLRPRPEDSLPPPPEQRADLPYNSASGHVQFFTRRDLRRLFSRAGLRIETFRNGAFLGSPLSAEHFLRGDRIIRWNSWVADYLPAGAVSTWYFTARRTESPAQVRSEAHAQA